LKNKIRDIEIFRYCFSKIQRIREVVWIKICRKFSNINQI